MLVPKISSRTVDPKLLQQAALFPTVLYTDARQAIQASGTCDTAVWADARATDAKDLLNSGLTMAVVSAADSAVDASRIAVRIPADTVARQGLNAAIDAAIAETVDCAGAVVVGLTAEQIAEGVQLARLCGAASAKIVGADGPVRVLAELSGGTWTEDLLRSVACAGADPVVDVEQLGELGMAAAIFAGSGLASDRDDGLVTTVVVDEQRVCLGVVYSNQKSLQAALECGEGVYWSRKRGLWHKGLTSGATQTLLGISIDCDADALCFRVQQHGAGFCHRSVRSCFGPASGLSQLAQVVAERREKAPEGSYTKRLFDDAQLLRAKLLEEATELADATTSEDVAFEAADLLYFAMVKCAAHGVSLRDVEHSLNHKHRKVVRRPGNAKPQFVSKPRAATERTSILSADIRPAAPGEQIRMRVFASNDLSPAESTALLQRPIIDSEEIMGRVRPIVDAVRANGDAAVLELTAKFDRVKLDRVVEKAPFEVPSLPADVRAAIDQAYANVHKFHSAQLGSDTCVETMPGVKCARFSRAIERVGLYVPGGTAVLPSSALMLGVPAQVAGCREIVLATPPRADGTVVPEVLYVAHKVGASAIVKAGGAQAIAAMAYGTETVPKVDKICGPGNQYVTAAKMLAQNDTAAMVSIDMPAGPSEVLVVADATSNPAYVASALLSQAEHGPDSQVVLLAVALTDAQLAAIENEVHTQASRLPRVDIVRQSIPKSFCLRVSSMQEAMQFSNAYGPEHLILHNDRAADYVADVVNAGSVFVGPYSPESCGDYASGTNHTLPTYGFSKMYSGVNTGTFLKHITSQELTREGLANIGQTVMTLAEVEELEAHRNAVAIRLRDME
ncbi:trifunctional histidinol dehydrogenase [Coemansia sp. RSA 1086]|nr:trifunctional histidinol dehydrogenase [Coemansia sp. RSA 1086]